MTGGEALDELRGRLRTVVRARPAREFPRARSQPWALEHALHRPAQRRRGEEPAGQVEARARPLGARAVLGHVAGGRHGHDRRAPRASARRERAVARVADDEVGARHRLRVADPLDQPRVGGTAAGPAVPGAGGPRARAPAGRASPRARRAAGVCSWSCEVLGATRTSGSSPGGHSTSPPGGSHISGPGHVDAAPASARGYSSCGKVADQAEVGR